MIPHLEQSQRWKYFVLNLHHLQQLLDICKKKNKQPKQLQQWGEGFFLAFLLLIFPFSWRECNSVLSQPPPSSIPGIQSS